MTDDEAREKLECLIIKHLKGSPDANRLMTIVRDKSRPGLPVRGVLEIIGRQGNIPFDESENVLIEELIYRYG
jgi:hypothetical protein